MTVINFNAIALDKMGKNTVSLFACGRLNIALPELA